MLPRNGKIIYENVIANEQGELFWQRNISVMSLFEQRK